MQAKRPLTFRDKQVIELIRQGKFNKEIAWELGDLSEGTIKIYVTRIFDKVAAASGIARNRAALAVWAEQNRVAEVKPAAQPASMDGAAELAV